MGCWLSALATGDRVNPEGTAPQIDSRRAKLAGHAAEQIIADVVELGWPVGRVLGSESELLARYGVSRAVLREAVRLVEHQRVARMRRGKGGGLVIDEPDVDAVVGSAVIYLLRVGATLDEILDTMILLGELAAEIASQRVTEADIATIRGTLERETTGTISNLLLLHIHLAELTANPILELFVETLTRVAKLHFNAADALPADFDGEVGRARADIATAILTNNAGLARERMQRHLRAEADFIRRQPATVQHVDPAVALAGRLGVKRGEALARQIFTEIVQTGAQPGTFIGSEAALMSAHRASRAVVREAIRILEYHRIAVTRRGPGGGLFVTEPDILAVVDLMAIYLRRRGVATRHIGVLRTGLELAVVERATTRLRESTHDTAAVEQALRAESEQGMASAFGHRVDFHSVLAALTGNRALQLLHGVTMHVGWQFFTRFAADYPGISETPLATAGPAHEGIAEALLAGDAELAVMRMRAHMAETAQGTR